MVSSPLASTPPVSIVKSQGAFVDLGDRGDDRGGVRDWDAVDACRRMHAWDADDCRPGDGGPPLMVLLCSAAGSSSDWAFPRVCRGLTWVTDDEAALTDAVDCLSLPGAPETREDWREAGEDGCEGGEDGREVGLVDTAEGLAGDACCREAVDALLDCTDATDGPRKEMPRAGLFGRAAAAVASAVPLAGHLAASSGRNLRIAPSKSSWSSWSDTLGESSHNAWTRWRDCSSFSRDRVPSTSNFSSLILPSVPSSPVFTGGKALASLEPPT
mmetsp:Transcript_67066/g.190267  ORF Transcript_67066/g.190267 Transcript_67066/m.190267 type:complete len:271 (-) Transcript_67066:442-1254(-)